MPKSSGRNSSPSPIIQSLPANASLENLRKQAKSLLKALRAEDVNALARLRTFHPRSDHLTRIALSDSQLVVARGYGFPSWPKLKQHVETIAEYSALPDGLTACDSSDSVVDRFISLACLNYTNDHASRRDEARKLLSQHPDLARGNIFAAATVGDTVEISRLLHRDPTKVDKRGGPRNWEPLLYATYSRLNSEDESYSTTEVARILLENGADPNAGFLWDRQYLFTALTGAFGEGERGPTHQPPHRDCERLARLLLEAGADPNDGQALYNRMFSGGISHLELLFEFGLGKTRNGAWYQRLGNLDSPIQLLQQQSAWAIKYNQLARLELLIERGVDLNQPDSRFKRLPYELAIMSGNSEVAKILLKHGARKTALSDLDAFTAACLNADEVKARALFSKAPTLVEQLGLEQTELLNLAAESDKRDAIRLMATLGFDLNKRKRTAPIHMAAACGHLEMVKLLIELGADPSIRDEEFNGTPLGWAEYSAQTEVINYLKSLK